jgi:MFS family permease
MPAPADERTRRRQVRRSIVASTVGTSIEWYDFFLFGTAAALVFPKVFFPNSSTYVGTLESFGTYAIGFFARPIGAAFFGHFGDRIGRKATLISTLLLMGLASAAIGLLPGNKPTLDLILLIVLRTLQGIGVGGEWGGSVVLAMEWGDQKRRGLVASFPQAGVAIGLVLSTLVLRICQSIAGPEFLSWGWRVPFLLSLVLVAVGLWIRLGVMESSMFTALRQSGKVDKTPWLTVLRRHPREVGVSAMLRLSEQAPFYLFTVFVLSYGTTHLKFSKTFMTDAVLYAALVSLVSIPFFGYLSDRVGRRRLYQLGALLTGVYGFVYFGLLNTAAAGLVVLAVIVSLIPHDMQYGPQAAFIAESFPTKLRYSGAGLGYQLASIIAGGPAPLIATYLLHHFGSSTPIAIYIAVCCVLTLVATMLLPDRTHQAAYEEPDDVSADGVYPQEPTTATTTGTVRA